MGKTYRVTVHPTMTDEQAARLAAGVELEDGDKTAPAQLSVITEEPGRTVFRLTIYEGKNRQIRRMCEAVGLQVARLRRIAVGPVKLGMLQPASGGDDPEEVRSLRRAAQARNRGPESENRWTGRRSRPGPARSQTDPGAVGSIRQRRQKRPDAPPSGAAGRPSEAPVTREEKTGGRARLRLRTRLLKERRDRMLSIRPVTDFKETEGVFKAQGLGWQGIPAVFLVEGEEALACFDWQGDKLVVLQVLAGCAELADALVRAALAAFYRRGAARYALSESMSQGEKHLLGSLGFDEGGIEIYLCPKRLWTSAGGRRPH